MRLDHDGSCAAPRPLTCVFSTNETACARGEAHCRWLEKQARLRANPAAGLAIAGAQRWPHTDCSLAEMPSSRRPRKGALSQVCLNSGWPSQLFNASTGPGLHRRRRPYSPRAPLACGLGAPSEAFSI